jgi:hypothetical protein
MEDSFPPGVALQEPFLTGGEREEAVLVLVDIHSVVVVPPGVAIGIVAAQIKGIVVVGIGHRRIIEELLLLQEAHF